jgi:hypothetical protein
MINFSGAAIGVSNSFLSKDFVGSLDYNLFKIERKKNVYPNFL